MNVLLFGILDKECKIYIFLVLESALRTTHLLRPPAQLAAVNSALINGRFRAHSFIPTNHYGIYPHLSFYTPWMVARYTNSATDT